MNKYTIEEFEKLTVSEMREHLREITPAAMKGKSRALKLECVEIFKAQMTSAGQVEAPPSQDIEQSTQADLASQIAAAPDIHSQNAAHAFGPEVVLNTGADHLSMLVPKQPLPRPKGRADEVRDALKKAPPSFLSFLAAYKKMPMNSRHERRRKEHYGRQIRSILGKAGITVDEALATV
jgi:hypothetical protein